MSHWANDAVFYHIYPLGFCGAPAGNDFSSPPVPRLEQIKDWVDHLVDLGVNALYLGPVFESTAHGYDTADYYHVDRRLGNNDLLADTVGMLHERGIRVVLDGVFNHVGRDFWAFRDVLAHGPHSPCCSWFEGLSFDGRSGYGDPFTYVGWNGHKSLVKLNLFHPDVRQHLFQAVEMWIETFQIDGLRLDAADCIDLDFLRALSATCKGRRPDFWLMGEVVHGDYRRWANADTLDSVTNYECYKSLYSSHVEGNYYEIAYALDRQFGAGGLYRGLPLYNFADNHDVDRVASTLADPAHLYALSCLLFTIPGVPSIYYGSEWGIEGKRQNGSDRALRPYLPRPLPAHASPHPDLPAAIARLARLRRRSPALKYGGYRPLHVAHEQLAFARETREQSVVVVVNAAEEALPVEVPLPGVRGDRLVDLLDHGEPVPIQNGRATVDPVWPRWARVLEVR